jgi:hypothetical protein
MIWDLQAIFDDSAAITVTRNSANVYDLIVARDLAPGEDLYWSTLVTTAFAGAGASLTAALTAADDAALTVNPTTLATSGAVAVASLALGYKIRKEVSRNLVYPIGQRYLGVIYTVASGPFTAGKIYSGMTLAAQDDSGIIYPRAPYKVA